MLTFLLDKDPLRIFINPGCKKKPSLECGHIECFIQIETYNTINLL